MSPTHEDSTPSPPNETEPSPPKQPITLQELAAQFPTDTSTTSDVRTWFRLALHRRQVAIESRTFVSNINWTSLDLWTHDVSSPIQGLWEWNCNDQDAKLLGKDLDYCLKNNIRPRVRKPTRFKEGLAPVLPFFVIAAVSLSFMWVLGADRSSGPVVMGIPIVPSTGIALVAASVWVAAVVVGERFRFVE